MTTLRGSTLVVRFLCELSALAALAYWGFDTGEGAFAWILGLGAPLAAASVWGVFVAPKARRPVGRSTRLLIEFLVFASAAAALGASGQPWLAAALGVAALTTSVLNVWTA